MAPHSVIEALNQAWIFTGESIELCHRVHTSLSLYQVQYISPKCNIYLSVPLHFLDNNYSKNKQNHKGRIQIPTFLTSKHRHKKPNTHIPDLKASRDMSFGIHSWISVFLSRQRKKTKSRPTEKEQQSSTTEKGKKKLNNNLRFLLEMGLRSSDEMGLSVFCK